MTPALQSRIFDAAPNLYEQRTWSMQETCMCWGIDTGDGWSDIIMDLSRMLEPYAVSEGLRAVQVKEKFGTLRFYVDGGREPVVALIDAAEQASARTCEDCGRHGTMREGGWIRTLCDECEAKR